MSMGETSLPPQWTETTLGEISEIQGGIQKGKKRSSSQLLRNVPYLRVANVQRGYLDLDVVQLIQATEEEISQLCLQVGDVLFNEGGDRDKLGRGWIWTGAISECIHQNHVFRARIIDRILNPKLLSWYGNTVGQQYFFDEGKQTTNLASLNSTKLKALPVLVPPQAEQVRILEAIESYLTRLDDAMATLEHVQHNLKRYRASVLKAAVEGRLVPTEAELARAQGRESEPASVLLERILAERRLRWEEAELAKLKAKGKVPKNDTWKTKYVEPAGPDINELPELPEGWCWSTLDALASVKGGITKGQPLNNASSYREVPYLRVANVQRGYLDLTIVKTIVASEKQIEELKLKPGDVLFNEGGDRDKLGRGWVWRGQLPECIHQNHVFRARIQADALSPELLSWYGNTSGQRYFFDEGKQTTNLASINMTKLRRLPVPLPPRAEQTRILEAVEAHLSVADSVVMSIHSQTVRCNRLRQSILKWAFEGRLVDQDPNDEPAEVLLERIRTERAVQPAHSARNRRQAPRASGGRR